MNHLGVFDTSGPRSVSLAYKYLSCVPSSLPLFFLLFFLAVHICIYVYIYIPQKQFCSRYCSVRAFLSCWL